MSYELDSSLGFELNELFLHTKVGKLDLRGIFQELNIFDSLFAPSVSGSILINDSLGLTDNFLFDGTEVLQMKISKNKDLLQIEKKFRIHKQTNRTRINDTTEKYILHFVSEEFFISLQKKVSQLFTSTYSEAAVQILQDYLNVPTTKMFGTFDNSLGLRKIVIPNLPPLEAINWMAQRSVDENYFPGFLFFENVLGYNYASLNTLLKQDPVAQINFDVKNTVASDLTRKMYGARHFEVIQQFDSVKNVLDGVYAGTFYGIDPVTRTFIKRTTNYQETFGATSKLNKAPNIAEINSSIGYNTNQFDARHSVHAGSYFRKESNFIKENDPESLNFDLDTHNYVLQRKAVLTNLTNQRVKLVVPGNLGFSSGFNLYLNIPKYSQKTDNGENLDKTLYGKYIILASRQIITYNKHETVLELVTDSSNRSDGDIYKSSSSQMVDWT
jgi:hypothetical protein